jgi:hypothetical protein
MQHAHAAYFRRYLARGDRAHRLLSDLGGRTAVAFAASVGTAGLAKSGASRLLGGRGRLSRTIRSVSSGQGRAARNRNQRHDDAKHGDQIPSDVSPSRTRNIILKSSSSKLRERSTLTAAIVDVKAANELTKLDCE